MNTSVVCSGSKNRWSPTGWRRGLFSLTLTLAATAAHAAPGISFSATRLDYGKQLLGQRSPAQALTLTNNGTSPLTINSLSFTGTNPGDFVIGSDSGEASLAPGASRTVGLQFRPLAVGPRSAVLAVSDNATGSPQLVSLSGSGVTTYVNRSPSSINFGDQYVYVKSTAQIVTVRNDGNATLHISGAVISGTNKADFTADTSHCTNVSLAPGGTCTIPITFTPWALGGRSATLCISDDAPYSPHLVSLSGNGVLNPALLNAPSNLAASVQAESEYPIHLTWTDNSFNEIKFELQSKVDQGSWYSLGSAPTNATSVDVGYGWGRGHTYGLRLRVVNSAGTSPWSNEVAVVLPPRAPYNFTATGQPDGIALAWKAYAGYPWSTIEVWRMRAGSDWILVKTVGGDSTSTKNYGMTPGVLYTYRLRATRNGIYSGWSNQASAMMSTSP